MMAKFSSKTMKMWTIFGLLAIVVISFIAQPTYASIPGLDQIRVALFLDGKVIKAKSSVTISAAQGISIGNRIATTFRPWISIRSNEPVRFSLDRFGVQLLVTNDYVSASTLANQLVESGIETNLWKRTLSGKAVYQVVAGPYSTQAAAANALATITSQTSWSTYVKSPKLTGPIHLTAGTFSTETEAVAMLTKLEQAGLMADLVYTEDATGKLLYAVWIGNEADAQAIAALKTQSQQAFPSIVLQQAAENLPYAIRRDEVENESTLRHWVIGTSGQKLLVSSAVPTDKLVITEKAGLSYRGVIELSAYNGNLAVINELPFETYIASVVTSEMGTGWPLEALKAQTVAARSYALAQGMKYTIAHISDTTIDQAYAGKEAPDTTQAANATKGEVLVDKSGLIEPFYSANSGGKTADPSEIWGGRVDFVKPVLSPDEGPAVGRPYWSRVALQDGTVGYIDSSLLQDSGQKNKAGLPVSLVSSGAVNVRMGPSTSNPIITKANTGDRVTVIGVEVASNSYGWFRGPYDASQLTDRLKSNVSLTGPLTRIEISKKGPSDRVMELKANGQVVKVSYPYVYRQLLFDVPSTRFEIEETGRYTIQRAGGQTRSLPDTNTQPLAVQSASGSQFAKTGKPIAVLDGSGNVRVVTQDPQFIIRGFGYGHGIGMSQWGARGMAEQGSDYKKILTHYYTGVSIIKAE